MLRKKSAEIVRPKPKRSVVIPIAGGICVAIILLRISLEYVSVQWSERNRHEAALPQYESTIRDMKSLRNERDGTIPAFFAGLNGENPPKEGFTLKQLRLCEVARGGPLIENRLLSCDDPTCIKCILPEDVKQVEPLIKGFWDTDLRSKRQAALRSMFPKAESRIDGSKIVHVIAIDFAQMHTALNWICNYERFTTNVSTELLLVPAGKEEFELFRRAGLNALDPELSYLKESTFPHKQKGFKFGMSNIIRAGAELVDMGYDVILQDADIVWRKDVLPRLANSMEFANIDILTQADVRFDAQGPANTGFVFVKSNAKTRIFMLSMVNLVGLVYHMQDDQRLWNQVLKHYFFQQLHFEILPFDIIRGIFSNWSRERLETSDPGVVHRVGNQDAKSKRKSQDLYALGLWNFNNKCRTVKPSDFPEKTFSSAVEEIWIDDDKPVA